jgi:hypothetical protein
MGTEKSRSGMLVVSMSRSRSNVSLDGRAVGS